MTSKNCKLTPSPMKVGFFLSKDFTMIALASVIEVLRMANQLTGENLYKWITLSETGEPVSASDSLQINVDQSISQHQDIDLLIVCGGINIKQNSHPKILNWLCHLDRSNVQLGGICTGSYMLAKAGLLEDQPCSIHWEYLAGIQEEFPRVMSSNKLFSTSANRMTCSGGTAPMDMMLSLVTKQHGHQLSSAISEMFVCERIRNSGGTDWEKLSRKMRSCGQRHRAGIVSCCGFSPNHIRATSLTRLKLSDDVVERADHWRSAVD